MTATALRGQHSPQPGQAPRDASRDDKDLFRKSAEVYLNYAEVEVRKNATFIKQFNPENLDTYRM